MIVAKFGNYERTLRLGDPPSAFAHLPINYPEFNYVKKASRLSALASVRRNYAVASARTHTHTHTHTYIYISCRLKEFQSEMNRRDRVQGAELHEFGAFRVRDITSLDVSLGDRFPIFDSNK